jgi:hypothetical protein
MEMLEKEKQAELEFKTKMTLAELEIKETIDTLKSILRCLASNTKSSFFKLSNSSRSGFTKNLLTSKTILNFLAIYKIILLLTLGCKKFKTIRILL